MAKKAPSIVSFIIIYSICIFCTVIVNFASITGFLYVVVF